MKPLYAAVITAICTGVPSVFWVSSMYALANHAILNPGALILLVLVLWVIIGGVVITFIPGLVWNLLADPDPFEELEDEEEK